MRAGAIGFHDVTVRYDGAAVNALSRVSFQLSHTAVCGVVGRTGSGKSTLAKALFRVVVPEKGYITLVRPFPPSRPHTRVSVYTPHSLGELASCC